MGGESAAAGGAPADRARSAAAMAAMAARVESITFYRPATITAVSGLGPALTSTYRNRSIHVFADFEASPAGGAAPQAGRSDEYALLPGGSARRAQACGGDG